MIISRCIIIIILPSIYIYMILSFVKQYNLLYLNEIYIYKHFIITGYTKNNNSIINNKYEKIQSSMICNDEINNNNINNIYQRILIIKKFKIMLLK